MDEFYRQARINLQAIWLMAKRNPLGARLIEDDQRAVYNSVIALIIYFFLSAFFDFITYPRELADGFIAESVSQNQYVFGNLLILITATLIGYYLTYTLMNWLSRGQFFPAVFVCFNWFTFLITPVVLFLLAAGGGSQEARDASGFFMLILTPLIIYLSISLQQFVADLELWPAIGLVLATGIAQILVQVLLSQQFGLLVFPS